MALKVLRLVVLAATFVAFVSHMPVDAGDSCHVSGGVLSCPGDCGETFRQDAPVQITPFKMAVDSTLCQPNWDDLKRVLPGVMVLDCAWKGVMCPIGNKFDGCPCILDVPLSFEEADKTSTLGTVKPDPKPTPKPSTTEQPASGSTEPVMEVTTRPVQALSSAPTTRSTSKPLLWVPTMQSVVLPRVTSSTELPEEPRPGIQQSKIDWLWIKLDDVDEVTILLATVSSLLTLGLFKVVCWVIRRVMNKIKGLVDKSVSSSVEKRLARREQELMQRMEEGQPGSTTGTGGRIGLGAHGGGPLDWKNGIANENVGVQWGPTAMTHGVSPVASTPYARADTITGEVPSPWRPSLEEQIPVPPRRKIERGAALKNKRGTELKQAGMATGKGDQAVGPATSGFREVMVEYQTKKPEPGMGDISEEDVWPETELSQIMQGSQGYSTTRLEVMETANTSFTAGDETEDADMSAKLAGINIDGGKK